jgi:MFS family permease
MNWIISAFNLASAAFIPFWAQFSDIFGRHIALLLVLILMIIGSALCSSAPVDAFPMLIFGRAIQGLSCAGINVITKVILADKVSLKEYSKNYSFFSFFAGLSYAIGPVIGGFLTDSSWRWCFGINIPVALLAVVLVYFVLRKQLLGPQPLPELAARDGETEHEARAQRFKARMSTIDYGGQFLFLFGLGLLILALTWGGANYRWTSAHVLVPLVLGGILSISFVFWEFMMEPGRYLSRKLPTQRPTIPWSLSAQRNMALLFYINTATGMGISPSPSPSHPQTLANPFPAMVAVLYFVDIYFVLVKSYTPSKAGIQLLYYTPGLGVGVYLAMIMCNFYPRQTFHPLFLGSIIEATGLSILTWALWHGHIPTIYGMMGLTGAGTGLRFMPGSLHGIGFFPNNIASVMALSAFSIPFGGTIAMTIMDTVFNNKAGIPASGVKGSTSGSSTYLQSIDSMPQQAQDVIRHSSKMGVFWAFVSILPFMWLCVLAAACLGNVRITRKQKVDEKGRMDFSENVTERSFLGALFGRRFGRGKECAAGERREDVKEKDEQVKTAEVEAAAV